MIHQNLKKTNKRIFNFFLLSPFIWTTIASFSGCRAGSVHSQEEKEERLENKREQEKPLNSEDDTKKEELKPTLEPNLGKNEFDLKHSADDLPIETEEKKEEIHLETKDSFKKTDSKVCLDDQDTKKDVKKKDSLKAENLGLFVVYGRQDSPDLPTDPPSENGISGVAYLENEIDIHEKLFIQDLRSKIPRRRKQTFFVWPAEDESRQGCLTLIIESYGNIQKSI